MPRFGKISTERLNTCDKDLQILFDEVVKEFDCIVLCGARSIEEQKRLFKEGRSKIDGINKKSKHNYNPSRAVDVAPYFNNVPHVRWKDANTFYFFAGYVLGTAEKLYEEGVINHRIRWGGDWDSDKNIHDQSFNDLVHFELVE